MEIYVVQEGDDIYSIATKYTISIDRLIQENGLVYPFDLIIGQALVITYPKQTYTVQQGDTLQSIADMYNVKLMQLLRNNQSLLNRKYLYVGETLVISYETLGNIATNGFTYPFISKETLIKTLPSLTYLTIFNYSTIEKGEIKTYYNNDAEIIKISKEYGTIPLMMITTLDQQGKKNEEIAFEILNNEVYQDNHINNFLSIIKIKGYQGINIVFNYLNMDNQLLYEKFINKIANKMKTEELLFFITINYQSQVNDGKIELGKIDYAKLSTYANGLIFLKFEWGFNNFPPAPVININNMKALIDYVVQDVTPDKINISIPIIGYDWSLPYIPNESVANSLSINSVLEVANSNDTKIEFDEVSQTPFFYYTSFNLGASSENIIWFVDARSMKAALELIFDKHINGCGIWNIMIYNAQVWTVINSQFDVVKL